MLEHSRSDVSQLLFPNKGTHGAAACVVDSNLACNADGLTLSVRSCGTDPSTLIRTEHLSLTIVQACSLVSDFQSNLRFIIDSGASAHMLPAECLLRDVDTSITGSVSLGDTSKKLKIVGAGITAIPMLGLTLLVPELSYGLISISALDGVGCKTLFLGGKVYVFVSSGQLLLTGTLHNKLYFLDAVYVDAMLNMSEPADYPVSESVELVDDGDDFLYYNSDNVCAVCCSLCDVDCLAEEVATENIAEVSESEGVTELVCGTNADVTKAATVYP